MCIDDSHNYIYIYMPNYDTRCTWEYFDGLLRLSEFCLQSILALGENFKAKHERGFVGSNYS